MKIIGLNLAGTEEKITGLCLLGEDLDELLELKSDKEIISKIELVSPDIVVIDSPLSFPDKGNWRQAEHELNKRKIKFSSPKGLVVMEQLVMRGIKLKDYFQNKGYLVIEVSSNAFYNYFNLPSRDNYLEIKRLLKLYNIFIPKKVYSQNELNSIIAAFTGRLFLETKIDFLGDEKEGQIVVPKLN